MPDVLVRTYKSKQVAFDKSLVAPLTEGEGGYVIVCLTPEQRWLLLTLLEFYPVFANRWSSDWTEKERDQLHSQTLLRLICPMACEEHILLIIDHLAAISLTQTEIRDRLGDADGDLDVRLDEIKVAVEALETAVLSLDSEDILDQLEPILNGVGVILGAPDIPILP